MLNLSIKTLTYKPLSQNCLELVNSPSMTTGHVHPPAFYLIQVTSVYR